MSSIYNHKNFKGIRKLLRINQTKAERLLWRHLRSKQLDGLKFFRQYSVGSYILDFYCPKKRLAIEVDGGHHAIDKNQLYDQNRSKELLQENITVLRFWNNEIYDNIDGVVSRIREVINQR